MALPQEVIPPLRPHTFRHSSARRPVRSPPPNRHVLPTGFRPSVGVQFDGENWDDFWFCMRTKGYSAEQREKAIKEHYRAKEFVKYGPGKPSSEDVWESRDEKVPEGTTFNAPVE
ncbi:uncharacterized protein FTOL_13859 [Fusarium torulosum]|uniref:Uncharacterized protein n=1 Tax=Fusarium torulosum TaxID=33205 RepID=A0AAE8MPT1_9HYPO|nr:uncharacterized protein FTOL_13859 [Fusarium torulosum]